MLHECKDAKAMIEMQCEVTRQTSGYYPNSSTLLKIVSPFIRKRYMEHAQTHVIETLKPKRERLPGGGEQVFVCANCLGAHANNKCPYECSICGTAYCGAASVGGTCAVGEAQFPAKVLDAKGNLIPKFLYDKLKVKHERIKGGGSSAQLALPAPAATQVHEALLPRTSAPKCVSIRNTRYVWLAAAAQTSTAAHEVVTVVHTRWVAGRRNNAQRNDSTRP